MEMTAETIRAFLSAHPRNVVERSDLIRAGVLMLLFPRNGELHVLLTRRSSDVEHHKGQVSFPGGSVDSGDKDIIATALREAEEEVGLRPDRVEVLGMFDDVWTPSGFAITPVVGYTGGFPALSPSTDEVEEILEIPVSFFLDPRNERVKKMERRGKEMKVYFYTYGVTEVWGATASILRSFLRALNAFARSG